MPYMEHGAITNCNLAFYEEKNILDNKKVKVGEKKGSRGK